MNIFSATLKQIGLPPWEFAASQQPTAAHGEGYYTKAAYARRKENRQRAIAAFKAHGPMSSEDLAHRLDVNQRTANAILGGLVATKTAMRMDGGIYILMEASNAEVQVMPPPASRTLNGMLCNRRLVWEENI